MDAMSTTHAETATGGRATGARSGAGIASRLVALPYSLASYLVGVGGLGLLALSLAEVVAWPGVVHVRGRVAAAGLDLALVSLFGASHSVMARPGFKRRWTRLVPRWAERSTFVLVAGLVLAAMVALWQPLPGVVWSVGGPAATALWTVCALGWGYLLASTFAIDHFDLFGVRQAYLHALDRPYTPVPFKEKWMYRYSRHPIMVGVALGVWATPHMTAGHLVMALAFSAYIAVGLWFEERDLVARFGDTYRHYRAHVGAFLPRSRS